MNNGPDTRTAPIDFVFDGPPGPEGPRFIEAENMAGEGVNAGEWLQRPNGQWVLRVLVVRREIRDGVSER